MSLFGSLFTGVTGLSAQSRAMGMISDNVANVSTTAYKRAQAQFATMVVREAGSRTHRPGGVTAQAFYTIANQGPLTATNSPTDVAIVGSGFFVVRQGENDGDVFYTRAGDFEIDALGNLRTPSGFYVQGWRLDQNGAVINPNQLATINVQIGNGIAMPTTRVALGANLDAQQPPFIGTYTAGDMAAYLSTGTGIQPHFTRTIEIYDSLGRAHQLTFAFLKDGAAPNSWFVEIVADNAAVEAASHPNGLIASGTVTFNGNGTLATVALTPTQAGTNGARIDWLAASGADPSDIVFDLGTPGTNDGLTQFASPTSVAFVSQNGAEVGQPAAIAITEEGYLVASFTNGQRQRLYRLALATFPNPAGLDPRSGNVFAATDRAGEVILRGAGEAGAGRLVPSALEASNVDLADEFTKMIVTQRAYSANARVISATDEMLDELIRLRR